MNFEQKKFFDARGRAEIAETIDDFGRRPRCLRLAPPWLYSRNVRITRSGWGFFVLFIALAIAAFNTGNNLLYLILAMTMASLPISFLLSEYMIAELHLRRDLPVTVTAGEGFTLTYEVRNHNRLAPSAGVALRDLLPDGVVPGFLLFVRAGQEVEVRVRSKVPTRGRRRWEGMELSTVSPFGWFRKTRMIKLPGELVALPRPEVLAADLELLSSLGNERPRGRRGQGEDLFGFRRYTPGDAVRDIHWKTSARLGELMVREREAEEERRLRIELRLSAPRPTRTETAREAAVSRAAGLVTAALERGFTVRVEHDGRGVDFVAGPGAASDLLLFLALFDGPGEERWPELPRTDADALVIA
jgi:uncharacterized protein (DUF58 family)